MADDPMLAVFVDALTMRYERVYPHPIELVWEAVTTSEHLDAWMIPVSRVEPRLGVRDGANPAADRERDEDVVGAAARQLGDGVALLVRGGDVEEDDLVGALLLVADSQLDRVARVADVDEVGPLDDPSPVDVEARDDALEDHGYTRGAGLASSAARPSRTVKRPS